MEKGKSSKYPADRHVNSRNLGVRINNDLLEIFTAEAEKIGRSRNSLIVEWIEDFCFKNRDK